MANLLVKTPFHLLKNIRLYANWSKIEKIPVERFQRKYDAQPQPNETFLATNNTRSSLSPVKQSTGNHFNVTCDYYKLLGVQSNATLKQIKDSYYLLAKKYHPDAETVGKNSKMPEKFQQITEAYHVLCDRELRDAYDCFKSKNKIQNLRTNNATVDENQGAFTQKVFRAPGTHATKISNLMKPSMELNEPCEFGISSRSNKLTTENCADEEVTLKVTFTQAIFGHLHNIKTEKLIECTKCKRISRVACKYCNGTGKLAMEKMTAVRLPAAVCDGQIVKVVHPFDHKRFLRIRVQVDSHAEFQRNGLDILSTVEIPWMVALLGGELSVNNIYGKTVSFNVRPGTHSHMQIRLDGRGIVCGNEVGDHIVTTKIIMPKKLTLHQKNMLKEIFKN